MAAQGATVHPELDLFAALRGGGRGVVARARIPEGETLLAVPKAACMYVPAGGGSSSGSGEAPALRAVRALDPPPSNFMATVLLLMAERAAGPSSAFTSYLSTLPPGHEALTAWSPAELATLAGTALEHRGGDSVADIYARKVVPLVAAHPEAWPAERCDEAAFVWALGTVQSRAFHLGEGSAALTASGASGGSAQRLYMIPGVDMVNHSSDAAARATELRAAGDDAGGVFLMVAERDICAGEEVLHSYGPLSDAQLLQTFGFVEFGDSAAANPHNTVHVASDLVADAAQTVVKLSEAELEERTDALGAGGLLAAAREVTAFAPLTDELLAVAQVLVMPRDAFDAWSDAGGGAGVLGAAVLGDHPDLGAAACVALLRAVEAAFKRLPGEDRAGEAATWRGRCAARLREGQRAGLKRLKQQLLEALCALNDGEDEDDESGSGEGNSSDDEGSSDAEASEEAEEEEAQQRPKRARRG